MEVIIPVLALFENAEYSIDLFDRNICLSAPNFSQMDDAQVSESIGTPQRAPIESLDNEPIGSCLPEYIESAKLVLTATDQ
jgi:hypothetical protein